MLLKSSHYKLGQVHTYKNVLSNILWFLLLRKFKYIYARSCKATVRTLTFQRCVIRHHVFFLTYIEGHYQLIILYEVSGRRFNGALEEWYWEREHWSTRGINCLIATLSTINLTQTVLIERLFGHLGQEIQGVRMQICKKQVHNCWNYEIFIITHNMNNDSRFSQAS